MCGTQNEIHAKTDTANTIIVRLWFLGRMSLRNDNWESLCCDFSPCRELLIADQRDMKGEWELEWTEAEGYRGDIEPGTEHISIFLDDENG